MIFSFSHSHTSPKNVKLLYFITTMIFPPCASAWMKLCLINMSKNASAPSLAITGLKTC